MNAGKILDRLNTVCPVESLNISITGQVVVQYRPAATAPQRAAAQAIVDGWTPADDEGTAPERRRNRITELTDLHSLRSGLVIEKTYWDGQPNSAAKSAAIQALIDDTDTRIADTRTRV